MEVGWSRFRGFENRSEYIMLAIEAMEFIKIVQKIQDRTATQFHKSFIKERVGSFDKFFITFMPYFPDWHKTKYEYSQTIEYAREKKYSKIQGETLESMYKILEKFSSDLSAAQSRDMDVLRAMH